MHKIKTNVDESNLVPIMLKVNGSNKHRRVKSCNWIFVLPVSHGLKKSKSDSTIGYNWKIIGYNWHHMAKGRRFDGDCPGAPAEKKHKFSSLTSNETIEWAKKLYAYYNDLLTPVTLEYENLQQYMANKFDALIKTIIFKRDTFHDFLDIASRKVTEDKHILDLVETHRNFNQVEQDAECLEIATKKFRLFWDKEWSTRAIFIPEALPNFNFGSLNLVNGDFFGKVK